MAKQNIATNDKSDSKTAVAAELFSKLSPDAQVAILDLVKSLLSKAE